MIKKLQDAINVADATKNVKAKKILLKIAELPENMQDDTYNLVLMMAKND